MINKNYRNVKLIIFRTLSIKNIRKSDKYDPSFWNNCAHA